MKPCGSTGVPVGDSVFKHRATDAWSGGRTVQRRGTWSPQASHASAVHSLQGADASITVGGRQAVEQNCDLTVITDLNVPLLRRTVVIASAIFWGRWAMLAISTALWILLANIVAADQAHHRLTRSPAVVTQWCCAGWLAASIADTSTPVIGEPTGDDKAAVRLMPLRSIDVRAIAAGRWSVSPIDRRRRNHRLLPINFMFTYRRRLIELVPAQPGVLVAEDVISPLNEHFAQVGCVLPPQFIPAPESSVAGRCPRHGRIAFLLQRNSDATNHGPRDLLGPGRWTFSRAKSNAWTGQLLGAIRASLTGTAERLGDELALIGSSRQKQPVSAAVVSLKPTVTGASRRRTPLRPSVS